MELLGADADLCTKTKLESVRKTGRRIDIHHRRINLIEELLRIGIGGCDDGLRMSGFVSIDMINGFLHRVYQL